MRFGSRRRYDPDDDECNMTPGLPCEIKHVTTDDNYVLQLEHIPNPGRPVALFMHGTFMSIICSADDIPLCSLLICMHMIY